MEKLNRVLARVVLAFAGVILYIKLMRNGGSSDLGLYYLALLSGAFSLGVLISIRGVFPRKNPS